MDIATTIYNAAKNHATSKGETVELSLDAEAYTGPETDRILYETPENKGLPMTIAKSLVAGQMIVFTTPEAAPEVRRVIAELEAA